MGLPARARSAPSAPSSDALAVNLRRTAVQVAIPPEQTVLLEVTEHLRGVRDNTEKMLREIFHPYPGWPQALDDLHRRAMSDFAHFVSHERAPEAVEAFCELYTRTLENAEPAAVREDAARRHLYYLEKVARDSGDAGSRLLPAVDAALERLGAVFEREPSLARIASLPLRKLVETLESLDPEPEGTLLRARGLLERTLRSVYLHWLAQPDPAAWWRERAGAGRDAELPEQIAAVSHARLAEHLARLDGAQERPGAVRGWRSLPDQSRIERAWLEAAAWAEGRAAHPHEVELERIRWLLHVVSCEALAAVHERAIADISRAYVQVMRGADTERVERLVRDTFHALHSSPHGLSASALQLVERVGAEAVGGRDRRVAQLVIDEMLALDFPAPRFAGFTDTWGVHTDPAHLRALRAFLGVIRADPETAAPLITALVIHLKVGGVFIADTDLFQRDVSAFLRSGIGPVYHLAKQLLRLLPVYFQDIGAEGELRDVSSRIDEISARHDPLCRFVRKQCHVECNPRLAGFLDAVAHFWVSGEPEPLQGYLPPSLQAQLDPDDEATRGVHRVMRRLAGSDGSAALLGADPEAIRSRLDAMDDEPAAEREKAALLFRLRRLIAQKYELGHDDLLERLRAFPHVPDREVEALRAALAGGRTEAALETLIGIIETLRAVVTSDRPTEASEDIYRKRHIAAGIPSLYGRYREEKLDAVGLGFRAESLANVLFEQLVGEEDAPYVTRKELQRVARRLRLLLRALRADGFTGRGLAMGISMLEQSLAAEGTTVDQLLNVSQLLARSVEQTTRIRFLEVYEPLLRQILTRMLERGVLASDPDRDPQETVLKVSEQFLRDLIAESLGLQPLDQLVGRMMRTLQQTREELDAHVLDLLLSYDPDRCWLPIDRTETALDGAVSLGNKGYMLKRMAQEGLPVPPGFILTTELFRCRAAVRACAPLRRELEARIREQVAALEARTGARFGDPERPLLLSVRSGAAISMPGILDTFLDVGIDEKVAEGLAARSGSAWGAWDAYRRFVQSWGMAHGLPRDLFDALMRSAKRERGVEKKAHFSGGRMRSLALRYRDFVRAKGIEIPDDPYEQLFRCADLVLRSWDSEKSRVYREELQIAEAWGTAVIVQAMVFGNLHERSGSGVALTSDSGRGGGDIRIAGDFIVQGQGDDVVSGVVETFPLSESQRLEKEVPPARSLEKDFPRIYRALHGHAQTLLHRLEMFHQEIEFTFESDDPEDLYILQTRDTVMSRMDSLPAFLPGEALERSRVASGIGAGGGALSGRVAHTAEDLAELRRSHPDDAIILIRPDTVPDDIPLVLRADGMLTALGGATSHAALVAQRLGRTCVVGCRELAVDEVRRRSLLAGRELRTGDLVSINGRDGSVYIGRHPTRLVRRRRLV